MSEYGQQSKEKWAHEQELWSKALEQHFQEEPQRIDEPSAQVSTLNGEDYWGENPLMEWPLGNYDFDGLQVGGSGEKMTPCGSEADQNEEPKSPGRESQYQETSKFGKNQQQPQTSDECLEQGLQNFERTRQQGSYNYEEIQHQGSGTNRFEGNKQSRLQDFDETQHHHEGTLEFKKRGYQEENSIFEDHQQQDRPAYNFEETRQQKFAGHPELNEQWNDHDPASPSRHTTPGLQVFPAIPSGLRESPKPNNLNKYFPAFFSNAMGETSQDRKDFLEYQNNVIQMHKYNQYLAGRKTEDTAKVASTSQGLESIQNKKLYDPATYKLDPLTVVVNSSNKRKRTYHEEEEEEEDEEEEEEEGGEEEQENDYCGHHRPTTLQERVLDPGLEEWCQRNLSYDPNQEYALRKGEREPPRKRTKGSRGGRPARPPIDDPRWNIWTVGDPTLKLRGSNISAEYLRAVLYEDAGCSGERRTKWSLPKLYNRLQQRREFREREARRMGPNIRPMGKPCNWSPENPWWTYFDDV